MTDIITTMPRFVDSLDRGLIVSEGWQRKRVPVKQVFFADLIVVDVQDEFDNFFADKFIEDLFDYCRQFQRVFQVWDSHKTDRSSYEFPKQVRAVSKLYGFDVDSIDFDDYVMPDVAERMRLDITGKVLTKGTAYADKRGGAIVYVGGGHEWFWCPPQLTAMLKGIAKQKRKCVLVGGAAGECLEDVYQAARAFGVDAEINNNFTYSARDREK